MIVHRGQLVKNIVQKSGYLLVKLAKKLNISRNTLNNRFKDPYLGYRLISQIGSIIRYDFSVDFQEINQESGLAGDQPISVHLQEDSAARLWRIEAKHVKLLEKYSRLLDIMIKVAHQNELQAYEKEFIALKEELKSSVSYNQ